MGLLNTLQFGRMANDGYPEDLPEGHVCMNKVVEVEETIYDEEMRRVHAVWLTGDIQKGNTGWGWWSGSWVGLTWIWNVPSSCLGSR